MIAQRHEKFARLIAAIGSGLIIAVGVVLSCAVYGCQLICG
ncbi:hypothetical protein [Blastopirellula marina]|nr:hypothetical protein [Blastopirellula marina]